MRIAAVVAAAGVLVTGTPAQGAERVTPQAVDAYARRVMEETGIPGMSVVVTHGRRVVRAAGYGHDSNGRPVTARTPMRIASVSKSFTAAAVMTLVDDGRIALDRPVAAQLPEFRIADPRGERITVRQLLNQTSGLADTGVDIEAVNDARSLREYVARLRTARLVTAPGTHWAYCNVNYEVAARLIEVASGMSYADYMRRRVFEPLGMTGSATDDRRIRPARGYDSLFGLWVARDEIPGFLGHGGAGGVITDAHDMGRWLIAQNGHARRVLRPADLRIMHTPGPGTGEHRYAMGWQAEGDRLAHPGNLFTYYAAEAVVPSTGYGVSVMVNGAALSDASWTAMEGLLALTEGRTPPDPGHRRQITELVLGLIIVVGLGLGVLGAVRARRWARRRKRPVWAVIRLVPWLIPVAVFAAYPDLVSLISAGRTVTWLQLTYFAAPLTIALATAAAAGLAVTAFRVTAWVRNGRR